jgi:hypothetical protein
VTEGEGFVDAAVRAGVQPATCVRCRQVVMFIHLHACGSTRVVTLATVINAYRKAGGKI